MHLRHLVFRLVLHYMRNMYQDFRTKHDNIVDMGWLRLVGSLKLQVSFAKQSYKREDILQKKPIIRRSLLIVATPYPRPMSTNLLEFETIFRGVHRDVFSKKIKKIQKTLKTTLKFEFFYRRHLYLLFSLQYANLYTQWSNIQGGRLS